MPSKESLYSFISRFKMAHTDTFVSEFFTQIYYHTPLAYRLDDNVSSLTMIMIVIRTDLYIQRSSSRL